MRSYKDDSAFYKMKINLTATDVQTDSFDTQLEKQKEKQQEQLTSGKTIEEFRTRISKELSKKMKSHYTSPSVHKIIDKFRPEIEKMYSSQMSPYTAAAKLIELHESGVVGFTHYRKPDEVNPSL